MKILISTLFLVFFFLGCSFKSPENKWEYNSASAFASYTKNFLTANDEIAQDDLNRAIKYSKQSANLEQLSRVYLGKCALNISIGIKDECKEYKQIDELLRSKELKAYFLMLQNSLKEEQIINLPKQYQGFNKYAYFKKYDKAFEEIENIKQPSSKFIASSLIKKQLQKSQVEYLINQASFYGFKKVVLFWLNYLKEIEPNKMEKEKISKKIKILKN